MPSEQPTTQPSRPSISLHVAESSTSVTKNPITRDMELAMKEKFVLTEERLAKIDAFEQRLQSTEEMLKLQTDRVKNAIDMQLVQRDLVRDAKELSFKLQERVETNEVKTNSFETRYDSSNKRTLHYIDESCEAMFNRAEKIIFDSFTQSRKETKDA